MQDQLSTELLDKRKSSQRTEKILSCSYENISDKMELQNV